MKLCFWFPLPHFNSGNQKTIHVLPCVQTLSSFASSVLNTRFLLDIVKNTLKLYTGTTIHELFVESVEINFSIDCEIFRNFHYK